MLRYPLSDKERADYKKAHRQMTVRACIISLMCGLVWGWTFMTPNTATWMAYLDAVNCVLLVLASIGVWRLVGRYRLRLQGRSFAMMTNVLELILIVFPRKEGDYWKVIQWKTSSIFNVLGPVLEPTGRGPSFAHALHDLMVKVSPMFNGVPEDAREEELARVNADLGGKLNELIAAKQSAIEADRVE